MSEVAIPGEAGDLEARLELRGKSGAVLCHPHPLYGGSMDDAVLALIDRALARADITSLRFNFRGVGASGGRYDEGRGEVEDVVSAATWFADNHEVDKLMLCGYSFGALMVLRAAPRVSCDAILVVAPPVQMSSEPPAVDCPLLVIVGEDDKIVDVQAVREFFPAGSRIETIRGADHFSYGADETVSARVNEFVGHF